MEKKDKIQLISLILITGFVFSLIGVYLLASQFHRGYPDNTFLFDPHDRFHDEINLARIWRDPYRSLTINGNLLPLSYLFLGILNAAGLSVGLALYLTAFLFFFFVYAWRNLQGATRVESLTNCFVFSFLTYPFLFCLDRANPEMYEFVLLACFVGYHQRGEMLRASTALAVAANFKPFPLFFLLLYVGERRWRDLAVCLGLSAALLAVALLAFGTDIGTNIRDLMIILHRYTEELVVGDKGLYFGDSLFGMLKVFYYLAARHHREVSVVREMLLGYLVFTVLAFLGLAALLTFVEKTYWKRIALIVLAMDLLPPVSADYKLLELFIPLFLFLNAGRMERTDHAFCVLFALLLVPKSFYPVHGSLISISIVLNPLLMTAMGTLIVREGLATRKREPIGEQSRTARYAHD